ncbi:MAG: methyl-accepting chemotaxis protein [Candidatus Scalinduaceae bacterium]
MKTMQSKLAVIFGVFLALGIAGKVIVTMNSQRDDSVVINLAGKQRMLTQKMTKEALSTITNGEQMKEAHKKSLAKTSALFDKTLKGLISGDEELKLPPTQNTEILDQLNYIKKLWNGFRIHIDVIINKDSTTPEYLDSVSYVSSKNIQLLKEMNKAVGMYEEQSTKKAATLRWSNTIIAIITVVTIILAWVVVVRPLVKSLTEIINNLSNSTDQAASASSQISTSSKNLAQGASEQASSIEETSASLEEMASMIKQDTDNAKEASQLASLCNLTADSGNRSVKEMNDAMRAINASSKKIGDIIKVIDGIAFQTNLLALNAAVEAARAGEHGKGFAVVAEEVRNLAQRSSNAAKDTTSLIEDCVSKADAGTKLSEKCKEVLSGIVTNVKKVTTLINEISTSSQEQSNGIDQVNIAINEVDTVTQQNAASAEETAAASEELSAQTHSLMDQVMVLSYHLGSNGELHNNRKKTTRDITSYQPAHSEHIRNKDVHTAKKSQSGHTSPTKQIVREDKPNAADGNGGGTKNVSDKIDPDTLIPMGKEKISEHDERFTDF